jgi:3-hydroxy-9,10-secoandrosta-1,3,5(10)-triene-9,17-dione monooxygenase reductase component
MDPPLVLWSLSKRSTSLPAYQSHRRWVINVLGESQMDVSNQFARRGPDKFAGVAFEDDPAGPILPATLATFCCDTEHEYDGGDHIIFVGRVTRFVGSTAGAPLLYFRGGYREIGTVEHPFTADDDWQSW